MYFINCTRCGKVTPVIQDGDKEWCSDCIEEMRKGEVK
jgi:hypothetical protein